MTSRLDTAAPDVVEVLTNAEPNTLRRLATRVVGFVLQRAGLAHPAIQEGLHALRAGQFGDSLSRAEVKRLVDSLDEQYWNLLDDAAAGHATENDYLAVFTQARAASALDFALDADPYIAASEGVYEALAALDDIEVIRQLIADEIAG